MLMPKPRNALLTLCFSIAAALPTNVFADHHGPGCKNCKTHHDAGGAQLHVKHHGRNLLSELHSLSILQLKNPCLALLEQTRQQQAGGVSGLEPDSILEIAKTLMEKLDSIEKAVKAPASAKPMGGAPAAAAKHDFNSADQILEQLRSMQSELDELQKKLHEALEKKDQIVSALQDLKSELKTVETKHTAMLAPGDFWKALKAGADQTDAPTPDQAVIDTAVEQLDAYAELKCKLQTLPGEIAKREAEIAELDKQVEQHKTIYEHVKRKRDGILNAKQKSAQLDVSAPGISSSKSIFRLTSYSDKNSKLAGKAANLPAPAGEGKHVPSTASHQIAKNSPAPAQRLLAELASGVQGSEVQRAKIKAFSDLSKKNARDYFEAHEQIVEAADAWKSDKVVTSCVFDQPATFQDPGRAYESGSSAVIREGMRFSSDGHGNWTLEAPYTAGLSPSEIHMQLRITMADYTQQTLTLKPICLPARSPCQTKGCTGNAPCATSDHSACSSTLKLKGYLPALDNSNGVFESVDRKGYAVYGEAYSAK